MQRSAPQAPLKRQSSHGVAKISSKKRLLPSSSESARKRNAPEDSSRGGGKSKRRSEAKHALDEVKKLKIGSGLSALSPLIEDDDDGPVARGTRMTDIFGNDHGENVMLSPHTSGFGRDEFSSLMGQGWRLGASNCCNFWIFFCLLTFNSLQLPPKVLTVIICLQLLNA